MGRFAPKYPAYVREAITAAVAGKVPAKRIEAALASGELEGLDGNPWPMPSRTVREYCKRARERIDAGGWKGNGTPVTETTVGLLIRQVQECRELSDEGLDALEIMERTGLDVDTVLRWVTPDDQPLSDEHATLRAVSRQVAADFRASLPPLPDDASFQERDRRKRERGREIACEVRRRLESEEIADAA